MDRSRFQSILNRNCSLTVAFVWLGLLAPQAGVAAELSNGLASSNSKVSQWIETRKVTPRTPVVVREHPEVSMKRGDPSLSLPALKAHLPSPRLSPHGRLTPGEILDGKTKIEADNSRGLSLLPPGQQAGVPAPASAPLSAAAIAPCPPGTNNNLLDNPCFEVAGSTDTKAAGWDDYDLGYSRVKVTPVKYNYIARVQIPTTVPPASRSAGASQVIQLSQTQPKTVFVGAMVKGVGITLNPDGYWGAFLDVGFTVDCTQYPDFCSSNGSDTVFCSSLPNSGNFDWRWLGVSSAACGVGYVNAAGDYVPVPIKTVAVYGVMQDASGTAFFDLMQTIEFNGGPGAVTMMFDDGYASTKSIVQARHLAPAGMAGTLAMVSGVMGDTSCCLTAQDVHDLQTAGWGITSHSVTHPDFTAIPLSQAKSELTNSKSALQAQPLPGAIIRSFAWPYGAYNSDVIALAAPLYVSTRSTDIGINAYGTFPYGVMCLEVTTNTQLSDVQSWLNDAKRLGQWAIILAHDVLPSPPDPTDIFTISEDFFASIVSLVKQSNLPVITYDAGIKQFAAVPKP